MRDEELLSRIRDQVREDRANDGAVEAVARGGEAPAELEPELVRAARPLGRDAEDRIVDRIGGVAQGDGKVVPLRRRVAVLLLPLALASAILLGVAVRSRGGPDLPGYAITATGEQAMRGPAEATSRLRLRGAPDARFTIVARPERPVGARVAAYAFAVRSGVVGPVDASVEVAEEGSVRVTGFARVLDGASELRLVIGASDAEWALARARAPRADGAPRTAVFAVTIDRD